MSSYRAGRFYLEVQRQRQIEQECQKALEQVEQSISEAKRAQQEMQEQLARRQAESSTAWAQGQGASRQLAQQREKYREQLNVQEAPAQETVVETAEMPSEQPAVPRTARKRKVVSLRMSDATPQEDGWPDFSARVSALLEAKEPSVRDAAEQLLNEMKSCPPLFRGAFLQKNGSRLEELEVILQEHTSQQQGREQALTRYEALCQMLQEQADPEVAQDAARCEAQSQRMMRILASRKGQQYIAQTLARVFSNYGITLQPGSSIQEENAEERSYQIAPNAVLAVKKSPGGAFEMEVQGRARSQTPTTEERRSVVEQAVHFCHLYPQIQEELAREGILVADSFDEDPTEENIVFCSSADAEQSVSAARAASLRTMEFNEK